MGDLELPALGRSFHLGTLYNCRTDQLITGWSLWDDLVGKITDKDESSWDTEDKDSFQAKCANLGVKGDLKLSLLGNMVKVEGSGSYVYDSKTTAKQNRLTLMYSSTTHREEMTMKQLMNVEYPDVLKKIEATHFVAAIDYGVEAFFVFELSSMSGEKLHDFKASLKAIPKVSLSGESAAPESTSKSGGSVAPESTSKSGGSAAPESTCKTEFNKKVISCKYHGDVRLLTLPTSYVEVVEACKKIADCKSSVPKLITLRKISELNVGDQCSSLFFPVKDRMMMEVEKITEYLHEVEINCQDLKKSDECQVFRSLAEQIDNFMDLLRQFKAEFSYNLSTILPIVRNSNQDDKLKSLISSTIDSPFNHKSLQSFISGIQSDLMVLNQYRENIEESDVPKVVHTFSNKPGKLHKIVHNIKYEQIFCLALNFNSKEDSIVTAMRNFLLKKENLSGDYNSKIENPSELIERSKEFLAFADYNGQNSKFVFVLSESCVGIDATGPVIVRYMNGKASIFKAPPVPMDFIVEPAGCNEFKLSWCLEEREDLKVAECNILFRQNGTKWDKVNVKNNPATIKHLTANAEYHFRVEAVFQCGVCSLSCIQTATTNMAIFLFYFWLIYNLFNKKHAIEHIA